MKRIADIGIALAELAEAEGRLLRYNIVRLKFSLTLTLLSLALILIGLAMLLVGLYQSLLPPLGPATSSFITGLAGLIIGIIALWIDHQNMR